jgi:single-stranded DNA-binding protein
VAQYLSKGRYVEVEGRLNYSEWEIDGAKRSKHEVVGTITFGPDKPQAD